MGDMSEYLEESNPYGEYDWDDELSIDYERYCKPPIRKKKKKVRKASKRVREEDSLPRELREFQRTRLFRDAYLAAIREHGCADTTEGILIILSPCEHCITVTNEAFPGDVRRPEVFYRGNKDRWRCLTKGCNPVLYGEEAAVEHKKQTGHRTATWPVRRQ